MSAKIVSATEFKTHAGQYLDEAAKGPIFITRHRRLSRVLIDASEYERLKAQESQRVYEPQDLPSEIKAALAQGYQGEPTPHLDDLLKP